MVRDELDPMVICTTTTLTALVIGLTLFLYQLRGLKAVKTARPDSATFRTKCAMCHGQDGLALTSKRP